MGMKPDIVSICTPDNTHLAILKKIISFSAAVRDLREAADHEFD